MSLIRMRIGKKNATVAYLTDDFEPTTKKLATMIKIIFDDGRVVFAAPVPEEPEEVPANQVRIL